MEYKIIDTDFSGGYSLIQSNNKYGLISKTGDIILKCEFIVIRYHPLLVSVNRILFCTSDHCYGFANLKGETICVFERSISFEQYCNTRHSILPFIKHDTDGPHEVDYCIFTYHGTSNNGLVDKYGNFLLINYNPCIIHQLSDFDPLLIESKAKQDYKYYLVDSKTSQPPMKIQAYSYRLRARSDRMFSEDVGKSFPAFDIENVFDEDSGKNCLKIIYDEEDVYIDYQMNLVKKVEYNKFQQFKRGLKFAAILKLNN